ncbi:Arc family DNA-binding protein [Klebsiella pneumoniae]
MPAETLALAKQVAAENGRSVNEELYRMFMDRMKEEGDASRLKVEAPTARTVRASLSNTPARNIDMTSLAIADRAINVPFYGDSLLWLSTTASRTPREAYHRWHGDGLGFAVH